MIAYTLSQLRDLAPAKYKDLDDEGLVQEYARINKVPFEQAADYYGVKPRGTLGEMRRQAAGSAMVDLPRMLGQGLKATGFAPTFGQEMVEGSEERAYQYDMDRRPQRGLFGQAMTLGARGLAPTVPIIASALLPGGQVIAPAMAAGLFGTSSYQETYEKVLEQTGDEAAARAAAIRVGALQGGGEGIATAAFGALARPVLGAVRGRPTTAGVAQAATDTGILRPLIRGQAVNIPVQAGTEALQDVGTEVIERSYGTAPEDIGEIAQQSALAGAGLALLLGIPLGVGGSVSRSRSAERLQQALYDPEATPEVREAARQQVMEAARQQGVAPANAEEWLQRQLREDAANIAEVQQQEEQTLDSAQETPFADIAFALRDPEISEVMSEEDRTRLFSTLTTLQDAETPTEQRNALVDDANETIGRYVAALKGPEAESDLMQPFGLPRPPVLTTAQPVQEINFASGLTQVQTNFSDPLSAEQPTEPVGRTIPREPLPTPVEGVEGIEAVRPGVFQVAQPLQQVSTFVGPRAPAAQPVSPVGAPTAVAAALPAAPVAAGVSSTATTEAPRAPKAPKAVETKTQRAKAPAAPAAAVVEDTAPKNVSEAIKEDNEIDRVLKAVEAEDNKSDKLFASVTGDTKKAPGKPSLPTQVYAAIRNAILNPKGAVMVRKAKSVDKDAAATEKYKDKIKRIADAARAFAAAYETYASQNLVRSGEVINRNKTADQAVANRATQLRANAAAVQQALAKLGQAVDGNAKDVEAVVRFVKDRAQGDKKGDGKTVLADITLSRAWTAAKSEAFMGEPDLLATTGAEVRQSREATARGVTPQLVDAATEGYATFGGGPVQTGLNGILNYIRTVGTPFEKILAQAIKLAVAGKAPIKIKFVKEGTSQYDPKTNTITINETSSKEVALHEALHGALQWFVYTNPNAAQVVALKAALQRVVNYDGKLPPKAAEVQALLKKILAGKSKTAELDAVLELVSYGNTLNDFRRALQGIESNAPRTFTKFANDVMDAIYALVRRMIGGKQSVASDVMENTFQLLEAARAAEQTTAPTTGNILRAEITSLDAVAREAGWADASAFAKGPGSFRTPTQVAFELIGLGRVNGKDLPVTTMIKESGAKTAEYIRKNVPTMERMILNFNSRFSNGSLVNALIDRFKFMQNTGYLQMERIAQHLMSHPEIAKPFLDFMDGNTKALDGVKNGAAFKAIAENLQGLMKQYIDSLPANSPERRAFQNIKFSQYLLHPENIGQVAGSTFGVKKLASMLGVERRSETSLDEFRTYLKEDSNGDVVLDDPLYQLFEDKAQTLPFGFISVEKFNNGLVPAGIKVDTDRVWKMAQFKEGAFQFTSARATVKDARSALDSRELSAALLNTTAALAHTFASRNFLTGLANVGRVDGKATSGTVAFNDVKELNTAFPDARITEQKLLEVSDESSKSPQIRFRSQRTGVWVKLPESETYGPLAGKIIPGPVWNSMLDMHDRSPLVNIQAVNDVMTFFKKAKTIYNPGTHVTNILSNVTLAILHGITPSTMKRSAKLFLDFEFRPDSMSKEDLALMKAFNAGGSMLGTFSSTEIKKTVYDKLNQAITPDSDSSYITRLKTFSNYEKAKAQLSKYDRNITEIYAAEDNIFRLAAFLNTAGNIQVRDGSKNLSDAQLEEAGLAGRKLFLDYDIDARAIRAMRQSFMPFISWSYAVMPVLGRIAIEKPWAMANVMMTYALMSAALGSGEDEEEMRKAAPEYLRDRAWGGLGPYMHMRLPFLGDEENPVYFNLGKYIPMFTLFQPPPGETKLAGQEWVPGFASPSGPFATLLSAMSGFDPFTGKPMHDPTDTQWDKLTNTGKAVYNTMAPAAVNTNFWKNVGDLSAGVTGPTGVEKSSLFLARNLGGLGFYQFNVDESAFYQRNEVKKIKRDFNSAMAKAKRLEYSKGYPDYEALDAELDTLRTRLQEEIAKARGEE